MTSKSETECVKVMVRVRPMNGTEKGNNCKSVIKVDKPTNQIQLFKPNEPSAPGKIFPFHSVYDPDSL